MKCPACSNLENKVIDSRLNKEGNSTRRRRECLSCQERFTTYERIEKTLPYVIKKDGRREEFNREKILSGVKKACQKRPVSIQQMELLVEVVAVEVVPVRPVLVLVVLLALNQFLVVIQHMVMLVVVVLVTPVALTLLVAAVVLVVVVNQDTLLHNHLLLVDMVV